MNTVRFELIELPYPTLARFGLTQEMIEDLPMRVLDEICDGRHSPVLPVRVRDEKGELIESRSRFALVRRDDSRPDVVFYPVLESSPLERYDEAQQKQLLDGKAIIADVETADGRMKPGELQSGGYGFYYKYKDGQPIQSARQTDVLQDLQTVITPIVSRPRSTEPARTYKELIASPVYFSNEKWQECLASHGLIVDKEARTLTVQSEKVAADMVYDLTKEETAVLTSNSIEEQPVEKRLEVLNGVIRADFADKVTMADLDSERRIALGLHPEVQEELTQRQQQEQEILSPLENQLRQEMPYGATASVDGRDISVLDERKGWYREERHGREVEVGEIAVHPSPIEGKYKMTAVIDGQVITHEISQKDYDKFLAVDDYHRMKIFSKIFSEVDMKMRPEAQRSLGVKIFAALTAGTVITAGVVHGLRHHHHGPEFYGERFGGPPHPYFKPGVDTPRDVAIRNFEAQMNQDINDMRRGR